MTQTLKTPAAAEIPSLEDAETLTPTQVAHAETAMRAAVNILLPLRATLESNGPLLAALQKPARRTLGEYTATQDEIRVLHAQIEELRAAERSADRAQHALLTRLGVPNGVTLYIGVGGVGYDLRVTDEYEDRVWTQITRVTAGAGTVHAGADA